MTSARNDLLAYADHLRHLADQLDKLAFDVACGHEDRQISNPVEALATIQQAAVRDLGAAVAVARQLESEARNNA